MNSDGRMGVTVDERGSVELAEMRHGTPVSLGRIRVDLTKSVPEPKSRKPVEPMPRIPSATSWRGDVEPWVFNAVQVLLAALTIVALGSLLAAIPNGLLGQPDMRIEGPMYRLAALSWFHDRVAGALPQPLVLSVSLWFYKAAMLAWALWLSFALVRWVRWAWDAYGATRLWNRNMRLGGAAPPVEPPPVPQGP
jgi:hypothetical protein